MSFIRDEITPTIELKDSYHIGSQLSNLIVGMLDNVNEGEVALYLNLHEQYSFGILDGFHTSLHEFHRSNYC